MVFHLPRDVESGLLIQGKQSPWKMLYATQEQVKSLGPEWAVRGVYLLLGPSQKPGNYWVRVGKSAPGTLRKRVPAHLNDPKLKDSWTHALLVCSTVGNGFNSADAGYLEGELANLLDAASRAELHEGQRDQDDTLEPWELEELEPVIEVVLAVMRVLGYSPDQPDGADNSSMSSELTKAQSKLSIGDLIEASLLAPGDQLFPSSDKFNQVATVNEDGTIEVEGETFPAPSPAAEKLVGHPRNGWTFWNVEEANGKKTSLNDLRKRLSVGGDFELGAVADDSEALGQGPLIPLIEAELLKPGDELVAMSKGLDFRATVSASGWVVHEGKPFSPSTIAKMLAGYSVNGWEFWRLDSEARPKLSSLKKELETS
jgi:hypothetical protein